VNVTRTLLVVLSCVLVATRASAQDAAPPSTLDKIWRFAEIYRSEANPVVQRVLFTGRFQQDFAGIDADEGTLEEWNVRRLRLGPRVTLFKSLTLHGEFELNPQERNPFYMRITDMYAQWSRTAPLVVTVGKQGVPFTIDGATSSKELLTIDRSNLSNNLWFPQEYMSGVSVSGKRARWTYRGGIYSAGAANREFGEFSGGLFTLGVLGYDFAEVLDAKEAVLAANYVYQHPDRDNNFTRRLEQVLSINFKFDRTGWGLRADVTTSDGYLGQSDVDGVMAMPFINVTKKLQLVGRYTLLRSDDPNGVLLATYENRLVTGRGDRYDELYAGANYYFYGHKLKLQSGLQWAELDDRAGDGGEYSGVSWTTGLRVSW
jgi:phosphate-selective porin OprO and OprP